MSAERNAPEPGGRLATRFLAVIGALGILAVIGMLLLFLVGPRFGPTRDAEVQVKEGAPPLAVYGINQLQGTELIELRLGRPSRSSGSYSYYEADTRNIILLNRRTGESRRILPTNDRRIRDVHFLAEDGVRQDALTSGQTDRSIVRPPIRYYLVELESADDRVDLLFGRLSDERQAIIMRNLDGVDSYWVDDERLGLIVREGRRLFHRVVDAQSLNTLRSTPIETGL